MLPEADSMVTTIKFTNSEVCLYAVTLPLKVSHHYIAQVRLMKIWKEILDSVDTHYNQ